MPAKEAPLPVRSNVAASADAITPMLRWLVPGAVIGVVVAITRQHPTLDLLLTIAATGKAVVLFFTAAYWEDRRTLARGALAALVGALAWAAFMRFGMRLIPQWEDTLGGAGIFLFAWLAYRAARHRGPDPATDRALLIVSCVFALVAAIALPTVVETAQVLPTAWDARAYALDSALPWHSFHVGRLLAIAPRVRAVAQFVYDQIFVMLPVLVALRMRLRSRPATELLGLCVFTPIFGQIGYFITPVIGPAYAFQAEFPNVLPILERLPAGDVPVPPYLRNCMPSLHTAWALLLFWNTRPFRLPVRAAGLGVLVFMVIATLGFGFHYVVDLIAAVPFAVAAQAIWTTVDESRAHLRRGVIAAGLLATLAWVLAPRIVSDEFVTSPGLVLSLEVLTVLVFLLLEAMVDRAGARRAPAPDRRAEEREEAPQSPETI
jgi:hypothetical protein